MKRYFGSLLWLYPAAFREEMGEALTEAYIDQALDAWRRHGVLALMRVFAVAFLDALRNGLCERIRPAVSWRRDAELATRRLLRAPIFVAAIVGTLTVGLGAVAVVYTVVQKILIDPMPYKYPDDLYFVWRDYGPVFDMHRGWLGGTDVALMQKTAGVIEDAVGLERLLRTLSTSRDTDPTEVAVIATSPQLFDVLGAAPMLGRGFAASEVGPGRPNLIVLTHRLWRRLGGDSSVVGTNVRLNGEPYQVIGVMPPHFAFVQNASLGPPQGADAYITFDVNLAETDPSDGNYGGLIRARHGTPPNIVAAAIDAVGRIVDQRDFRGRGLRLYPSRLKADLVAGVRPALVILGLAGTFLVLVLVVNLASVLLARAAQREHEFAVSRALGADGIAIVRATILEGGGLGFLGGVAAAVMAIWGTRALVALAPLDLPRREAIAVDWRIAGIVIGLGAMLGLLAATVPAVWASRSSLSVLLAKSAVRGGGGHGRMRRGIVVAQVGLSLILLCTGGLVARSFGRLLSADPGFRPESVISLRVPMPSQLIPNAADVVAQQDRIESALSAIRGVAGVSAATALPLTSSASQTPVSFPGAPGNTGAREQDSPLVDVIAVRATYPQVIGMRVIAGRPFEPLRRQGIREVLIDRHLARQFFPTTSPLGTVMRFRNQSLTVVGVVDQARMYDVHEDGRPQVFVRAEDWGTRTMSFVVRSTRAPEEMIREVTAAIRGLNPELAISEVRTANQIVDDSLRQPRISAVLVAGFALGALALAAMGLFGVVSGSVTKRRHEFAVRLALGADHRRLLRLMLGESARLIGWGILAGLPGLYISGRVMRGMLVGVSASDPLTLAAVACGLSVVAMAACYFPARRVLAIEPARSLRED